EARLREPGREALAPVGREREGPVARAERAGVERAEHDGHGPRARDAPDVRQPLGGLVEPREEVERPRLVDALAARRLATTEHDQQRRTRLELVVERGEPAQLLALGSEVGRVAHLAGAAARARQ